MSKPKKADDLEVVSYAGQRVGNTTELPANETAKALDEIRLLLPANRHEFEMALQKAKRYNSGDNLWEIIQRVIDKIEEIKAR